MPAISITMDFPFLPDHNDLIKVRYDKIDAMRNEGRLPYPNQFDQKHLAADLLANQESLMESGETATVMGRVGPVRRFGKAAFFHVTDRSGKIQVFINKKALPEDDFSVYKNFLDGGDIVGVSGTLFQTKTGETTIEAASFQLLTKAARPLPEKWHGFKDVELRYRQRYVDLIANPDVAEIFRSRSKIVSAMRRFLDSEDFMEVETPMMHPVYGGAAARPFITHHNTLDMELYMRIAPELYLKRLVVGGLTRVYEINRNFRNEGVSTQHNPEFTMLELYSGGWNADDMMNFVEQIIRETARGALGKTTVNAGGAEGQEVDLEQPFPRIPMTKAVSDHFGAEITWDTTLDEIRGKIGSAELPETVKTAEQAIVFLFEEFCEDALVRPTYITEFPKSISPLAKCKEDRPDVADRFELYVNGMELANGFSELNDPVDQYERFRDQVLAKEAGDDEAMSVIDEDYVRALEHGLPPTAGLGIGIDRLVMWFTNSASIRDVILFPLLKPHAVTAADAPGEEVHESS